MEERKRLILVGTLVPEGLLGQFPEASAAAAKWQQGLATALGAKLGLSVDCWSFALVTDSHQSLKPMRFNIDSRIGGVVFPLRLSPVSILRFTWRLLRETRQSDSPAKAVICYNPLLWTTPFSRLLALSINAPLILVLADLQATALPVGKQTVLWLSERLLIKSARRFLVLSPASVRLLPIRARYLVFNGFADEAALSCPEPTYCEGPRKVVYAGSLSPYAGIREFLTVATRIARRNTDCEFHVFGRGSIKSLGDCGLGDRLTVHGFVPEPVLNEFLGRNCIGVNPRVEGTLNQYNTPYKVLFYLSRGVVTVSTKTEGIPGDLEEVVVTADSGLTALEETLHKLLRMPSDDLARIARRGRARVKETRSAEAFASTIKTLMEA